MLQLLEVDGELERFDLHALRAAAAMQDEGIARPLLVGGRDLIVRAAAAAALDATRFELVETSADAKDAATRGALFGLCAYAIYDFTNLSLLNNWSAAMAAVDMGWGAVLCGTAAALGRIIWLKPQPAR